MKVRSWEVVLIAIGLFCICSTSLYWYDRFNKSRPHTVENEMLKQWQRDTEKWQKNVTDNINGLVQSQQQVLNVLNLNFANGRLIIPKQEKK